MSENDIHCTPSPYKLTEGDTAWLAPDGRNIEMHWISVTLPFDTPFMFHWRNPEGKVRREVIAPAEYEPGEPTEDKTMFRIATSYVRARAHLPEGAQDWRHGVHIRAWMPSRQDPQDIQEHRFFGLLPERLTFQDLTLIAPAKYLQSV